MMHLKVRYTSLLALCCLTFLGCTSPNISLDNARSVSASAQRKLSTTLPQAQRLEPGILFQEIILPTKLGSSKLWVYLPEHSDSKKLPCVIVSPAGSRLFHGMNLGKGDRPEHIPYVRAGFAVVAYEVDGAINDNATGPDIINAINTYQQAEAGLTNARTTLDFIVTRLPQVDQHRIYSAGHSSAGTLSLLLSEREPRIAASIAYAPVSDVVNRLGDKFVDSVGKRVPDFRSFIIKTSPDQNLSRSARPLFLFHSKEDKNVSIDESKHFAEAATKNSLSITFIQAEHGNHYDSMIQEGIPRAIQWLQSIQKSTSYISQ
jgi:dipeptidyl aminopeptidase/acylaminoacyl peptidase